MEVFRSVPTGLSEAHCLGITLGKLCCQLLRHFNEKANFVATFERGLFSCETLLAPSPPPPQTSSPVSTKTEGKDLWTSDPQRPGGAMVGIKENG